MAKKENFFRLTAVMFVVFLVMSGCGKTSSNPSGQTAANNSSAGGQGARNGRMPDFGQPQRPADIRGIVKSIVGNEVDVLKVDIDQKRASSTPNGTDNSSSTSNPVALSLGGATGGARAGGGADRAGGGFGGPGGPGEPGGGQDANSRATMLAALKKLSTGEDKVIIPVGIQMLKSSFDSGTKKRTFVEASLNDITADKTITVWLNTQVTDKKVADFVLIN